jgi:hypothetical protein
MRLSSNKGEVKDDQRDEEKQANNVDLIDDYFYFGFYND